jgi:hypothetical protein
MDNKYITVLDFEVERIFQYELKKTLVSFDICPYEEYIIEKGHNLNNIEWMVHDIKEIVDHTIKSTLK